MTTPKFTMQPCKSSQVEAHGHCCDTNTLCVKFKGGGEYHYHGVTPADYEALCKAESVGKFLAANVKGRFDYTKQEASKA